MTRTCVVCKKLYTKGSDISFHSFPKNEARKELWLKACNMKLYLPSYKICDDHFLPEHYLPSGYLKINAVPFLETPITNVESLDDRGVSNSCSPCPSSMKRLCVEPITSTSTGIEPLDNHSTSTSCPSPMKQSCVQHKVSTYIDFDHDYYSPRIPKKRNSTSTTCPSPMKQSCIQHKVSTYIDFDHDYSSPRTPKKREVLNANSIGVLSPSHFRTPREAKRHLDMVKYKYKEKQIQNENLKKRIKRLKAKLTTFDDLVLNSHQKQFLTDNASVHLQANMKLEPLKLRRVTPSNELFYKLK